MDTCWEARQIALQAWKKDIHESDSGTVYVVLHLRDEDKEQIVIRLNRLLE